MVTCHVGRTWKPAMLQSVALQIVGHDLATEQHEYVIKILLVYLEKFNNIPPKF